MGLRFEDRSSLMPPITAVAARQANMRDLHIAQTRVTSAPLSRSGIWHSATQPPVQLLPLPGRSWPRIVLREQLRRQHLDGPGAAPRAFQMAAELGKLKAPGAQHKIAGRPPCIPDLLAAAAAHHPQLAVAPGEVKKIVEADVPGHA